MRNGDAEHLDKVIHGNEEVIRARFSDADFFYSQDIKKPLADFLPRLGTLTFQEKLGSMLDKNERIVALVEPLGDAAGLRRAPSSPLLSGRRIWRKPTSPRRWWSR